MASSCTCPAAMNAIDCPVHGDGARALVIDAIDHRRLIQAEPPGRCELCGAVKETRPYGPRGENVCFACGMKDEDAAKRAFAARMGITPDPNGCEEADRG